MKKIIVAIDGLNFKAPTVEFAASMALKLHSHLVGVFLHDRTYHSYKIYSMELGKLMTDKEIEQEELKDRARRQQSIQEFEAICEQHRIRYSVREDRNIAFPELVHESIYADVLVINSGEQFTHYPENRPSEFLRNLLEAVQCPVVLAPDTFTAPEKVVLLYDGTPESVYAIKMFCLLFSGIIGWDIEVLTIRKEDQDLHLPDNKLLKEYLKRHFPLVKFTVQKGAAKAKLPLLLKKQGPATMLVLGAYKRGMVSRWFRPSMADILLSTLPFPQFIAHSK